MNDWILEVWGDYACFTRPEMKVERVSYDVITPSAARAIVEAIFWKPAISWNITKIEVLHPIRWFSIRRNEIGNIASKPTRQQIAGTKSLHPNIYIEDSRQQRASLILRDVRYRIHAYFDYLPVSDRKDSIAKRSRGSGNESAAKYAAMFERRAKKGQCFHRPYLGCREFACNFRLVNPAALDQEPKPIDQTVSLGWMLYDLDFSVGESPKPEFFKAEMVNGVINADRRTVEVRS
jgi:CRISPR-associated protein Cas5d